MIDRQNIAVVLLSGGLDSAVTAFLAAERGFELCALTFRYGQRHDREIEAARNVAGTLRVQRHVVQAIDLRVIGGSALTDAIEVPKDQVREHSSRDIPVTYVPARNTIFLACALGLAEVVRSNDIFIGVNAVDYSGYPDCRPEFLRAFENLARVATRAGVEGTAVQIHAPLIAMSKAEIVREGVRLGVDFSLTHSCYDPIGDVACGHCDSCLLRIQGFREAGVKDSIRYATAT
ncbi:MAG: 7-cyano-7-deazaguanine synthase QueC [Planctomycetes bacterium]|nr:7-cyano-7-deazaguanine synthase QueC [Planctomycetota bacterium]MBI3834838.1 7-cyano-7-deazaguanine synthase QueC [Planctomycetota bacterium]